MTLDGTTKPDGINGAPQTPETSCSAKVAALLARHASLKPEEIVIMAKVGPQIMFDFEVEDARQLVYMAFYFNRMMQKHFDALDAQAMAASKPRLITR